MNMNEFDLIGFLERYPEMKPYVGSRYLEAREKGCALLVIGESHYLPAESKLKDDNDEDAMLWYRGSHDVLSNKEREWINTAKILRDRIGNGFKDNPTNIFKRGFQSINNLGPRFDDYRKAFDCAVVCNYFLRPAKECKSLQVKSKDIEVASSRLRQLIKEYSPNAIVFLSRKAFDASAEVRRELSIPIAGTPHPSCFWWYRKSRKYGNRLGCEAVADAVAGLPWDRVKQA